MVFPELIHAVQEQNEGFHPFFDLLFVLPSQETMLPVYKLLEDLCVTAAAEAADEGVLQLFPQFLPVADPEGFLVDLLVRTEGGCDVGAFRAGRQLQHSFRSETLHQFVHIVLDSFRILPCDVQNQVVHPQQAAEHLIL